MIRFNDYTPWIHTQSYYDFSAFFGLTYANVAKGKYSLHMIYSVNSGPDLIPIVSSSKYSKVDLDFIGANKDVWWPDIAFSDYDIYYEWASIFLVATQ